MENPILKVSEMIAENFINATLDFRSPVCAGKYVWNPGLSSQATTIIEPVLRNLDTYVHDLCKTYKICEELIDDTRRKEAQAGYKIGVIVGLHLAGRSI